MGYHLTLWIDRPRTGQHRNGLMWFQACSTSCPLSGFHDPWKTLARDTHTMQHFLKDKALTWTFKEPLDTPRASPTYYRRGSDFLGRTCRPLGLNVLALTHDLVSNDHVSNNCSFGLSFTTLSWNRFQGASLTCGVSKMTSVTCVVLLSYVFLTGL